MVSMKICWLHSRETIILFVLVGISISVFTVLHIFSRRGAPSARDEGNDAPRRGGSQVCRVFHEMTDDEAEEFIKKELLFRSPG